MSRLLRANFARLWKSVCFRLCMAFSGGLAAFMVIARYLDIKNHPDIYDQLDASYKNVDAVLFIGGIYLIFAATVFTGLFIGTEYSDGTVRNKLIVGRSRTSIYLSNLLVCSAAHVIINLNCIIITFIGGNIILEKSALDMGYLMKYILAGTAAEIAVTAILLLFSMLIRSKAAGSVTVLILTIVMFFSTISIYQRLTAPEYYEGYSYTDEDTGEIIDVPREKNRKYLRGTKRKVYEKLNEVLPVSQLYNIAIQEDKLPLGEMAVYDCAWVILTTAAGVMIFRKRDLK